MAEARPRAVIDTNVWISAFINPQGLPAQILAALELERFTPVYSGGLLDEITTVAQRPRIRRLSQLSDADLMLFRELVEDRGIETFPTGSLRLCRDPRDDFLLEIALLGRAQFLVSRDDDLKRDLDLIAQLGERGVEVVSVSRFLQVLSERPA